MGFKDRVMVLLRPSKGGGVEDMYKLTKGRSVKCQCHLFSDIISKIADTAQNSISLILCS